MSIRDIEDNYPDYLEDSLGYSFGAWDLVRAEDRELHDRVMAAESAQILTFDSKELPGVALWALAKRQSETLDSLDAFETLVADLVVLDDPCLDPLGICTFSMRQMTRLGQNERAERLLEKLVPLEAHKDFWTGLLARNSDPEGSRLALQAFMEKDKEPIEAALDIVETLIFLEELELARLWLNEAESRVGASGYTPALVDIELLRSSIQDKG